MTIVVAAALLFGVKAAFASIRLARLRFQPGYLACGNSLCGV